MAQVALAATIEEREAEQRDDQQQRHADGYRALHGARKQLQELIEGQEIPFRCGHVARVSRICRRFQRRAECQGEQQQHEHDDERRDDVLAHDIRPEAHAATLGRRVRLFVVAGVGGVRRPWRRAVFECLRARRDALPNDERDVEQDDHDEQQRQPQHVKRVESREGRRAELRAALEQLREHAAQQRRRSREARAHLRRPIRLLVPRQQVSCKSETHHDKEEKNAEYPVHFARILVGAHAEHADHVRQHEHDHRARAPAMHGAQQPARRDLSLHELDALVGVVRSGGVERSEHHAGHDLYHEHGQRRAAQRVPPRQAVRHLAVEERPANAREVDAFVEPSTAHRALGIFSRCVTHASIFASIPVRNV